jgi:hypothetical protein
MLGKTTCPTYAAATWQAGSFKPNPKPTYWAFQPRRNKVRFLLFSNPEDFPGNFLIKTN